MSTTIRHRRLTGSCSYAACARVLVYLAACGTHAPQLSELTPSAPTLTFENANVDEVAVYVDQAGIQWLLGHVQPGRSTTLRLPAGFAASRTSDLRLMIVPLGSHRDSARPDQMAETIRSELESADYIVAVRWTLRGHQLISVLPTRGRSRSAG